MNAKEFYELNRGMYFRLNAGPLKGETARLVGYDKPSLILSNSCGISINLSKCSFEKLDKSLFDGCNKFVFAYLEDLSKIEGEINPILPK